MSLLCSLYIFIKPYHTFEVITFILTCHPFFSSSLIKITNKNTGLTYVFMIRVTASKLGLKENKNI